MSFFFFFLRGGGGGVWGEGELIVLNTLILVGGDGGIGAKKNK
jgi:hypothetical protein